MTGPKTPKVDSHVTQPETTEVDRLDTPPKPSVFDQLVRLLGGSPGIVFLRLLVVSLIVGFFLMWLDIRLIDIFRGLSQLIGSAAWSKS